MDDVNIPYDLVVIGAGVNGLGVARDAALRGLRAVTLPSRSTYSTRSTP